MDSSEDDNDDPAALDGLSLKEAFQNIVAGDEGFAIAVANAVELSPNLAPVFYKGRYTEDSPDSRKAIKEHRMLLGANSPRGDGCRWPVAGKVSPMGFTRPGSPMERIVKNSGKFNPQISEVTERFLTRYLLLVGWLQEGDLLAYGHTIKDAPNTPLSASLWKSETTWVDWFEGVVGTGSERKYKVDRLRVLASLASNLDTEAEPKRKKPGPKKAWERQPKQYARLTKLLMDQAVAGELPDTKLDVHVVVEAGKLGITLSQTSAQRFLADSERMSLGKTLECLTNHGPS